MSYQNIYSISIDDDLVTDSPISVSESKKINRRIIVLAIIGVLMVIVLTIGLSLTSGMLDVNDTCSIVYRGGIFTDIGLFCWCLSLIPLYIRINNGIRSPDCYSVVLFTIRLCCILCGSVYSFMLTTHLLTDDCTNYINTHHLWFIFFLL